jgi:transcriptional regulator with XRE-family HTH domain
MEPSPFTVEFGRRMARRRRILGLKQAQIAAHVGMHRSHVTQLEGGHYQSMQLEQLAKLAGILQTSSDYLLQLVDEDPGIVPPHLCSGEQPHPSRPSALPATTLSHGENDHGEYTNFC